MQQYEKLRPKVSTVSTSSLAKNAKEFDRLSKEWQPVEFGDIVGRISDIGGGPYQRLLLFAAVLLLVGFTLLTSGIVIVVFESHPYFRTTAYILIGLGVVCLLTNIGIESWYASRSTKK